MHWLDTCAHSHCAAPQCNFVALPRNVAFDFLVFCLRNPKPCPLVEVLDPGDPEPKSVAPGADVRRDIPKYRIWRGGELAEEVDDISPLWTHDMVVRGPPCAGHAAKPRVPGRACLELCGAPPLHARPGACYGCRWRLVVCSALLRGAPLLTVTPCGLTRATKRGRGFCWGAPFRGRTSWSGLAACRGTLSAKRTSRCSTPRGPTRRRVCLRASWWCPCAPTAPTSWIPCGTSPRAIPCPMGGRSTRATRRCQRHRRRAVACVFDTRVSAASSPPLFRLPLCQHVCATA